MDDRIERIADDVLARAWLYADPASFREGVLEAVAALGDVDLAPPVIRGTWSFDLHDPTNCHECRIPFDDDAQSAEDAHCPWCGARKPEHLQELVWAELTTIELAYPESVGA